MSPSAAAAAAGADAAAAAGAPAAAASPYVGGAAGYGWPPGGTMEDWCSSQEEDW
jgi:hypothetical protein